MRIKKKQALLKVTIPQKGKNSGQTLCTLTAEGEEFTELMLGAFKTFYRAMNAMDFTKKQYEEFMQQLTFLAENEVDREDREHAERAEQAEILAGE